MHVHVLCTSFVERATKCLATADSCRECETEQIHVPMQTKVLAHCIYYMSVIVLSGAYMYEPPKAARSVQLRIIAQNGVCIYSST